MVNENKIKILLILVSALFIAFAYYFLTPIETFEYKLFFDVTEKENDISFDATNVSFAFGVLPRGAVSSRQFDVATETVKRINIKLYENPDSQSFGNWLSFSKNNFNLLGKKTLSVSLKIPQYAQQGHYEGKLKVYAYRTISF